MSKVQEEIDNIRRLAQELNDTLDSLGPTNVLYQELRIELLVLTNQLAELEKSFSFLNKEPSQGSAT